MGTHQNDAIQSHSLFATVLLRVVIGPIHAPQTPPLSAPRSPSTSRSKITRSRPTQCKAFHRRNLLLTRLPLRLHSPLSPSRQSQRPLSHLTRRRTPSSQPTRRRQMLPSHLTRRQTTPLSHHTRCQTTPLRCLTPRRPTKHLHPRRPIRRFRLTTPRPTRRLRRLTIRRPTREEATFREAETPQCSRCGSTRRANPPRTLPRRSRLYEQFGRYYRIYILATAVTILFR